MSLTGSGKGQYLRGSFERTSTTTPGYSAGLQSTTSTIFSNKGSLTSAFTSSAADLEATKPLQLTDVMPNTHFAVPIVPQVPVLDITQPCPEPADPSSQLDEVNAARENYLAANQACMDKICDAIVKVDPENGPAVIGKLMEPAMSGTPTALSTALNAGTGLAVYEVINALYKGMKGPNDAKVSEVLTKALGELHKSNAPVMTASAKAGPAPENKFDFTAIKTVQQLQDFVERDPKQDEVMMKISVAEENLNQMAANKENYREFYHLTGDISKKLDYERERGNVAMVEKLASTAAVADAVMAGARTDKVQEVNHMPSEVGGMNNFLSLLKSGVTTTASSMTMLTNTTTTTQQTQKAMAAILDNEPDPAKFDLTSAFRPGAMNS